MSGVEKRLYPRFEVKAKVDMQEDEDLIYHEVVNLSLGGMCIQSPITEEIGAKVELRLHIPGSVKPLNMVGEVAWSAPQPNPEMGVRFLNLDKDTYEVLYDYLHKKKKSGK